MIILFAAIRRAQESLSRCAHERFNPTIITMDMKRAESAGELLHIHFTHKMQFNAKHISTCWIALGKITKGLGGNA